MMNRPTLRFLRRPLVPTFISSRGPATPPRNGFSARLAAISSVSRSAVSSLARQYCLSFLLLPQWHGWFRPTFMIASPRFCFQGGRIGNGEIERSPTTRSRPPDCAIDIMVRLLAMPPSTTVHGHAASGNSRRHSRPMDRQPRYQPPVPARCPKCPPSYPDSRTCSRRIHYVCNGVHQTRTVAPPTVHRLPMFRPACSAVGMR